MPFTPRANETLLVDGTACAVAEHPSAPGIPYGQEGRQGVVYQIVAGTERRALKVFKPRYRSPAMVSLADRLATFADLPGLAVCRRTVLGARRYTELLRQHPDLTYAVLMPWIEGPTWAEVVLEMRELSPAQSLGLATSFLTVLTAMEERGIAHCDLSGPNVLLPGLVDNRPLGNPSDVALVDVEQLFGPGLDRPDVLPGGSPGYAHRLATTELWDARADRFTGALILAEMLGWCDEWVRSSSWGESYFDPADIQCDSSQYYRLLTVLRDRWGDGVAALFERAWQSETLADCATFGDWLVALPEPSSIRVAETVAAPTTPPNVLTFAAPLLEEARRLEESGDLDGAVRAYDAILAQIPSNSGVAEEIRQFLPRLRDILNRQTLLDGRAREAQRLAEAVRWQVAAAHYEALLAEPDLSSRQRADCEAALSQCHDEMAVADLFDSATLAMARERWDDARSKLLEIVERRPNGYVRNDVSAASVLAGLEKRRATRTRPRPVLVAGASLAVVMVLVAWRLVVGQTPPPPVQAQVALTASVVATVEASATPPPPASATPTIDLTQTGAARLASVATSQGQSTQSTLAQLSTASAQATASAQGRLAAAAQAQLPTTAASQTAVALAGATETALAAAIPPSDTPEPPTPTQVPPTETAFRPALAPIPPTAIPATAAPPAVSAPSLAPANHSGATVVLSWGFNGPLTDDEWFDVRVWKDGQPAYGIANVKQTSYTIGGNYPGGDYNWTIAVIRKQGGTVTTLAVAPQTLRFSWQPPSSGPGGPVCNTPPNC